jgi:hypothetical protein
MATSNVGQLPRQLITPGRQGSHLEVQPAAMLVQAGCLW